MDSEGGIESRGILELPKKHTSVIGDLDWSYDNFVAMIQEQWLISSDWTTYTGGSRKVVFSWDILADLKDEGFKILVSIVWLKNQARSKWWDISVLAWNHEEYIIWYLIWESVNLGVWEISDFLHLNQRGNDNKVNWLNEFKKFWRDRSEILENMRKDDFWRMILEEICQLKLVDISWDALFFHTPPTKRMLQMLQGKDINAAVNSINRQWQNILRILLLWESQQSPITARVLDIMWQETQEEQLQWDYKKLADIFLNTANDTPDSILMRLDGNYAVFHMYKEYFACETQSSYDFLHQQWITTIVYWHADSPLDDHTIRFIDINQRSIELNKPQDNQTLTSIIRNTVFSPPVLDRWEKSLPHHHSEDYL